MESDEAVDRLRALIADATFDHRFEVARTAGAGGMGRVYEARERDGGRRLAVKVLTGRTRAELARFTAEAEILERLAHPRIVAYVAHGVTDQGEPYLAMEWLDGESLAARLRRGRLDLGDALAIARQVATALAHAHAHGVVHRDVKPSNLMLVGGSTADVRLIDFGVARGGAAGLTRTGEILGTPGYMAPEQALGRRALDGRADLFGLGCTLYEALAGAPPFPGDEPIAVVASLLLQEPRALDEVRPEVPPRLAALVGSLLAKDVDARLADAAAVIAEVDAIVAALAAGDRAALSQRPAGAAGAATVDLRPRRRRGRRRWAVAAGLALVAGSAAVALSLGGGGPRPAPVAPAAATVDDGPCDADVRRGCAAGCAAGRGEACYHLGESLSSGLGGLGRDDDAGLAALTRGCELGSGRACTKAGVRILDRRAQMPDRPGPSVDDARRVLERGCALGSAHTCRRLGLERLAPRGRLPADDHAAMVALTTACRADDLPACVRLVGLVDERRGSNVDRALAAAAYTVACGRGLRHPICGPASPAATRGAPTDPLEAEADAEP